MKRKHSQNKFVRFITLPIRVLGRARDFYVRSLANYAERGGHANSMGLPAEQFSVLPKSYSVASSRSHDSEDYSELIRAASVRSMGHVNEIDMFLHQRLTQSTMMNMGSNKRIPKSCSVGMGFMGRIEEENPNDCGEDSVGGKSELYPRSKSAAVANMDLNQTSFYWTAFCWHNQRVVCCLLLVWFQSE